MASLQGKTIRLRPLEISDLDLLYQWENDSDSWRWGNNPTPMSRFFLEQYVLNARNNIYEDKQLRLVIEDKSSGRQAGAIDLFDFDPRHLRAAVGILVSAEHRNKRMGSQALDLVIGYARDVLCLKQLYCTISANNPGSLRLFRRKGFAMAGTLKNWRLHQGEWMNEYFLQLVFPEGAAPSQSAAFTEDPNSVAE